MNKTREHWQVRVYNLGHRDSFTIVCSTTDKDIAVKTGVSLADALCAGKRAELYMRDMQNGGFAPYCIFEKGGTFNMLGIGRVCSL